MYRGLIWVQMLGVDERLVVEGPHLMLLLLLEALHIVEANQLRLAVFMGVHHLNVPLALSRLICLVLPRPDRHENWVELFFLKIKRCDRLSQSV